ncbi:hypothetical protein EYF80_014269 [Liparis tanakae]|uniref:Uncharacterized protein n=1 Tax=Liparis tanakae TaxID=230148 RepID=A0A4Z2IBV3_9TELE|nr:hypothetical protein EYF80_014269 [Liparis tanakae]
MAVCMGSAESSTLEFSPRSRLVKYWRHSRYRTLGNDTLLAWSRRSGRKGRSDGGRGRCEMTVKDKALQYDADRGFPPLQCVILCPPCNKPLSDPRRSGLASITMTLIGTGRHRYRVSIDRS